MLKDRTFDPLGCVAGVSFLISGILVIQDDPMAEKKVSKLYFIYSLLLNQMKKQAQFVKV